MVINKKAITAAASVYLLLERLKKMLKDVDQHSIVMIAFGFKAL